MYSRRLLRRPAVQTAVVLAACAALYWLAARADPELTAFSLMVDLILGIGALLLGLAIVSQVVLPVNFLTARWQAFQRLLEFASGVRGPVVFVRDGQAVESQGERLLTSAGVLLVDHASAAVLRTATRFTRAVGPGVTFLEPGESLAQALDLRIQRRTIPAESPDSRAPGDSPATLAVTEDGILVSAEISVTFLLDPGHDVAPRSGQFPHAPAFEFNRLAAERAVFGQARRDGDATPWADLPLRLAVDRFRDEIERWRLADLLRTAPNETPALSVISERLSTQLARGRASDRASQPAEDAIAILTQRGVRVLEVEVSNLRVPTEVQAEHFKRWRTEWVAELEKALQQARSQGQDHLAQGQSQGLAYLVERLTQSLSATLEAGGRPAGQSALAFLLADALRILEDPALEPEAAPLRVELKSIAAQLEQAEKGGASA